MRNLLKSLLICLSLALGACSLVPDIYKIDIQQGNVIEDEMLNKLHPGMTKRQVKYVLGTPVIVDVFHQDRWDYIYSFKHGSDTRTQHHILLIFKDDKLVRIEGDVKPDNGRLVMQAQKEMPDVYIEDQSTGFIDYMKETFYFNTEEDPEEN
ncbi:MAG: outer membrane protein assembly factor BamE [Gammaproteobacteria bacterium]|nr:outer membrane protein assembly factor BamE [Gammaproteobacteria bacterium]